MNHSAAPGRFSTRRALHLATTALTAVGLLVGAAPAGAQTAPPTDPPARAGRVAFLQGSVSSHAAGETSWRVATHNDPVTNGNAFWTEPQALAEIEVDATSLWLNGGSELDVDQLDLTHFAATGPQGELYLHLRNLAPGETYTLQTPRGLVTIAANGRYDIFIGDTQAPTTVSVLDGLAQIVGPNVTLRVPANQTATITGAQNFQGSVGALRQDPFLAAMLQRERPANAATPPAVACMAGGDELAQYGTWQSVPQYGQIWYPQVESGWAPYRHGHWAFDPPWGWTWVDDASWGFAPFHYGRWVQTDDRWGWIPIDPGVPYRRDERPVYSPALVSFFGVGAAAAVGAGLAAAAFSHGNIGWVPLGPREAYYPPYRVSPTYLRRINETNVTNINTLNVMQNRDMTINRFVNHGGASIVPSQVLAESRPVAASLQRTAPADYEREHPVFQRAPVAPTAATQGVTPAVARSFGFPAGAPGRPAPGPTVNPAAFQHEPGRPGPAPALRPVAGPAPLDPNGAPRAAARPDLATPAPERAVEPGGVPQPRAPGPRPPGPESGPPALRPPGSVPPSLERPGAVRAPDVATPGRPEAPRPPGIPAPARPEPPRVEPPRAEPPRAEPPRAEPPRAEPPRAEPARPEPPRVEPPHVEQPRAAPAERPAEPARQEPPRAAPPRPEPPRPAPPPPHQEAPRPAPQARPGQHEEPRG